MLKIGPPYWKYGDTVIADPNISTLKEIIFGMQELGGKTGESKLEIKEIVFYEKGATAVKHNMSGVAHSPKPTIHALGPNSLVFSAPQEGDYSLLLYRAGGRVARTVSCPVSGKGTTRVALDIGTFSPGVYLVLIKSAAETSIQKCVIR
jgi:hypothetical protein